MPSETQIHYTYILVTDTSPPQYNITDPQQHIYAVQMPQFCTANSHPLKATISVVAHRTAYILTKWIKAIMSSTSTTCQ